MGIGRVDTSIERVNVKLLGCTGDGATNDTARFQAAVDLGAGLKRSGAIAGRTVYVPDGVYLLDAIDLPTGTTLILSDGAVLKSRLGNAPILRIGTAAGSAGDTVIEGGKLLGTWDYATYQNGTSGGRKSSEQLIKIDAASVSTISSVVIRRVSFDLAGDVAVRVTGGSGDTVQDITIEHCTFLRNYSAINVTQSLGAGTLRRITIRGNRINETWDPGAGVKDASKGGNAIGLADRVDDVLIENNRVVACGRIALEVTSPSYNSSTNRNLPVGLKVLNNTFARSRYRTWSVFAFDQVASGNTIDERDYLEVGGRHTAFVNNIVRGPGVYLQNYSTDATKALDFSSGITVSQNSIEFGTDLDTEIGALFAQYTDDVQFTQNTIVYGSVTTLSAGSKRAVFRVDNSRNLRITDNHIRWTASVMDRPILRMQGCSRSEFSGNHVDITATSVSGVDAVIQFNKLDRCRFERNTIRGASYLALPFAPVWNDSGDPVAITRRKFSAATTYTDTAASYAVVLNAPPGSPVTNGYYLVGDNPTGAWAGQPRTFAKWDGAAWSFETVTDLFNDLTALSSYFEAAGGAPTRATTGDTYAIVTSAAMVKCAVKDNRFDETPNNLKGAISGGITFNGTTNAGQVAWQNTFSGNDLAADYATRGKTGIAT